MSLVKKRSEADMMLLLRRRFREGGPNGGAWAFIEQVRSATGAVTTRTLDAVAMSLWPSRGLELHGFEVKCSREDWLRELKDPLKAETFVRFLDRFWLVVSDKGIVADGELPPTWGLLVPHGRGLKAEVVAPVLPPAAMTRSFLAALMRHAAKEANTPSEEVAHADRAGYERGVRQTENDRAHKTERLEGRVKVLEAREKDFFEALGEGTTEVTQSIRGMTLTDRKKLGEAIMAALNGRRDLDHLRRRIERIGQDSRVLVEQVDRILSDHGIE